MQIDVFVVEIVVHRERPFREWIADISTIFGIDDPVVVEVAELHITRGGTVFHLGSIVVHLALVLEKSVHYIAIESVYRVTLGEDLQFGEERLKTSEQRHPIVHLHNFVAVERYVYISIPLEIFFIHIH